MPDQLSEPSIVGVFTRTYDELRLSALATLLEPEWLEQKLPIGIAAIRA